MGNWRQEVIVRMHVELTPLRALVYLLTPGPLRYFWVKRWLRMEAA